MSSLLADQRELAGFSGSFSSGEYALMTHRLAVSEFSSFKESRFDTSRLTVNNKVRITFIGSK